MSSSQPSALADLARRTVALALAAVDPERLVRDALQRRGASGFAAVLAVGKAAAGLARGTRDIPGILSASPRRLLIRPSSSPALLDPGWEQASGGHPLPDRHSVAAGERLRLWLSAIDPAETLLALISGGASACVELPAPGLELDDLIATQRALLGAGLPIQTVNAVRKHLSALKGGGALRLTRGRVLALLLSDVPGDDPSTIGSGLFAADPTLFADALAAILPLDVPRQVREHLAAGLRGAHPETVKPGEPDLARVESVVLGNAGTAVAAVAAELRRQGFTVAEGALVGEASRAARDLVSLGRALGAEQAAVVLGGETTVTVSGTAGRGGRNGELALAAAREIDAPPAGQEEVVLSLATDGEDGDTRTGGAVVGRNTWEAVRRGGIDPASALSRHDSFTALSAVWGALLRTGPTGTNVGDLAVYLRAPAGMG